MTDQPNFMVVRLTQTEYDAIMKVASAIDVLGYAKRGSTGDAFNRAANRIDEASHFHQGTYGRCPNCKGVGWVE